MNKKTYFKSVKSVQSPIIINVAKDGQFLEVKQVGEISGSSNLGVPLYVKDVLYVPSLRDNLMLVKKLAKAVQRSENAYGKRITVESSRKQNE